MARKIESLYTQYQPREDRRKQNIPVLVERRSGKDRRSEERIALDKNLTRDIFQVKNQIEKLKNLAPRLFEHNVTTQNPTFADKNNFTLDQFVKNTKPDISEIQREEAKLKEKANTSMKLGLLTAALAGVVAVSFAGPAGALIAAGSLLYVGLKTAKELAANDIKDENNS